MAASILAKTARDAWMDDYARKEPAYLFEKHKGYPTAEHRRIVLAIGPSGSSGGLPGQRSLDELDGGLERLQEGGEVFLEDDHRPPLELSSPLFLLSTMLRKRSPSGFPSR